MNWFTILLLKFSKKFANEPFLVKKYLGFLGSPLMEASADF